MKNQKAITLISLVVTIVILIILAGVAINLSVGENGIITKAQIAKKQHEIAAIQEKLELQKAEVILEDNKKITLDAYLKQIKKAGYIDSKDIQETESELTKKVIVDRYMFLIEELENGDIKITYEREIGKERLSISLEKNITDNNQTSCTSLKATIKPIINNDSATILWSSSDTNVATVDDSGIVTGTGVGTTTITATATAADSSTATAEVNITINSNTTTVKCTGTRYTSGKSKNWERWCTNPLGLHDRDGFLASSGESSRPDGWKTSDPCTTSWTTASYIME